jgi:hypothetical protein
MPVNIRPSISETWFAAISSILPAISELCGASAVVLAMINLLHKLAKATGSDERAVVAGILAITVSIGGAVLFEALFA